MEARKESSDKASTTSAISTRSITVRDFFGRIFPKMKSSKPKKEELIKTKIPSGPSNQNYLATTLRPDRRQNYVHETNYKTNHETRGKAYIFNHISFKKQSSIREGTIQDEENLKKALPKLGFRDEDIKCFRDLTVSLIDDKLEEISKYDHSDCDLLMVFVLTHGEKDGKIYAFDADYSVNKICNYFTANECPTLKGKPKIFFIIACRGDCVDDGSKVTMSQQERKLSVTETDAVMCKTTATYTIPVWADFLIVYSTIEGYYSYRHPIEGTWYIQSFCQELKNFDKPNLHFLDFLTAVNRRVAISYRTFCQDNNLDNKKQCPFITSSMTRVLKINIKSHWLSPKQEKKNKAERPKSLNT